MSQQKNLRNKNKQNQKRMNFSLGKKRTNFLTLGNQVGFYKKYREPQISKVEKQKAKQRIDLDSQITNRFNFREQQGNFYLKYNLNPFLPASQSSQRWFYQQLKRKDQKLQNIVDQLTPVKSDRNEKRFIQAQHIVFSQYKKNKVDFQLNAKHVQKIVNSLSQPSNKFTPIKQKQNDSPKFSKKRPKQAITEEDLKDFDLQQIMVFKQENFFLRKKINIFKYARDANLDISSIDYLQSKKFSFNSVIERSYTCRIPVYRDLSYFARMTLKNAYKGKQNILQQLYSYQLTLDFNFLRFVDILSVASNRLSVQYLYKTYYADQKSSQSIGEDNQQKIKIIYKKSQSQKLNIYSAQNQQDYEIKAYKMLPYKKDQNECYEKINAGTKSVIDLCKLQNVVHENQIRDRNKHFNFTMDMKEQIKKVMFNVDQPPISDMQKTVRLKKANSNKNGVIRYQMISDMLKQKNYLGMVQDLLARRKAKKK